MSAHLQIPRATADWCDGVRRAKRAVSCIEDCMAISPDHLLNEVLDVLAIDSVYVKATPRMRGFMRVLAKRVESAK